MVEYFIVPLSLIIGIIIGWILKGRNEPADNTELHNQITILTDEKARAEAQLQQLNEIKTGMESIFKSLASDIAKENRKDFLEIANEKFKAMSDQANENLNKKKELIDQNLGNMNKTLKSLHDQSIKLTSDVKNSSQETQKLHKSTSKLTEILSSSPSYNSCSSKPSAPRTKSLVKLF